MEQTATLPRSTLLNVFSTALTEKVNGVVNGILSSKVKKVLIAELDRYVNDTIHTDDKPILLPDQFSINHSYICVMIGFRFTWKRSPDDEGEFEFACGGKTIITKCKKTLLDDMDCLRQFCKKWKDVKPYLKNQPTDGKRLTLMRQSNDLTIYESENCPICLDVWSADSNKKTAVCGHSCCWTCMKEVVMSNKPLCPVCRADYKQNGTFKYVDTDVMIDWYKKTKERYEGGIKMWELEKDQQSLNKGRLMWLKHYMDIPMFKRALIVKYGLETFLDNMYDGEMKVIHFNPDVNGVGLYILKQNH
jgi:hypothetical protein